MAQLDNAADSDSEERGFKSLWAGQKKRLASTSRFFSYIRLWRVILLCSDIRLKPSDIALQAVKWANIISLLR